MTQLHHDGEPRFWAGIFEGEVHFFQVLGEPGRIPSCDLASTDARND
jgi:hypothetical protein